MKSTCKNCDGTVVFDRQLRTEDQWDRYKTWIHALTQKTPNLDARHCNPEETDWRLRKYAKPKDYCTSILGTTYNQDVCNRKVKDEELGLCGIHARYEREKEEKRERAYQHYAIQDYVRHSTEDLIKELKEHYGIEAESHFSYARHEYTGKVVVNPRDVLKIMDKATGRWNEGNG